MTERNLGTGLEETLREKPHIAIAGASGRLGQRLQILLSSQYLITPLKHNSDIQPTEDGQEIVDGFDITDKDKVWTTGRKLSANGVQVVINAAGVVNVDNSEKERYEDSSNTQKVNEDGAENLALVCGELHIQLIHLSTEYVFDGKKPFGQTYKEDDIPNCAFFSNPTWYGLTKAWGESLIEEIQKLDLYIDKNPIILRVSQVQTPTSGLFAATLRQLDRGEPFTRANNQLASTLTDKTVAEAIARIIERIQSPKENRLKQDLYHISATNAYTPYEISLMLAEAYGLGEKARELIRPVTLEELVESGEQKVVRPKNSILDVTRFQNEFGPLPSVAQEIERFKTLYPKP